ncbi:MAG: low molecular weight phosphotyrosine protein phosphatase [bacterium]|nr:low molecular weight phosphotyrosine protein phosphatase [bacterium]
MIKVCFVCLGNICRSPMAEFVFKDMIEKENLNSQICVESRGTSDEELGNSIHSGTIFELNKHHIPYTPRKAIQLVKDDYHNFDYFISADSLNCRLMRNLFVHDNEFKIHRILDFTSLKKDIADPWYTGNFSLTYQEIELGCRAFLDYLKKKENF